MRTQGKSEMTLPLWGFYLQTWKQFISQLAAQRKHLILICHESVEKDEIDQTLKYFVQVAGQMKFVIGSMFTDVWRCEVAATSGPNPKHTFQVRTMPDFRYQLKNSLSLPPIFKFDWNLIKAKTRRMTVTYLLKLDILDPSSIEDTAAEVYDSLETDGFEVISVAPWARSTPTEDILPSPSLIEPPPSLF